MRRVFAAQLRAVAATEKQPLDADILVEFGPVNAEAVADELEGGTLAGAGVHEPGEEPQGHGEQPAVGQLHPEVGVVEPHRDGKGPQSEIENRKSKIT